jgi:hypothetical protein
MSQRIAGDDCKAFPLWLQYGLVRTIASLLLVNSRQEISAPTLSGTRKGPVRNLHPLVNKGEYLGVNSSAEDRYKCAPSVQKMRATALNRSQSKNLSISEVPKTPAEHVEVVLIPFGKKIQPLKKRIRNQRSCVPAPRFSVWIALPG